MTTYSAPKPAGAPTWMDLAASDPEGARAFYKAVFGWDYDIGGPEYGGYTTARLGDRTRRLGGIGDADEHGGAEGVLGGGPVEGDGEDVAIPLGNEVRLFCDDI